MRSRLHDTSPHSNAAHARQEMLDEVGHGAAMPTAPSAVQEVARYFARPVAEEGVATLIEQLVLASPAKARAASRQLAAEADDQRPRPVPG